MDIGKSFTFLFDDEDWLKKLLLGGLIALIPIVNFAAGGYIAEVAKNVKDDDEHPLPDWGSNFGRFFGDGVKIVVAMLIYFLPVILLSCLFGIAMAAVGAMAEGGAGDDAMAGAMGLLIICFQCGIIFFALIPTLFYPALFAQFVEYGDIGSMLRLGEVTGFIKRNLSNYIIVLLLSAAVMYFIAPLGMIACLIGVIFTQWWSFLVFGHLTGQLIKADEAVA